MYSRNPKPQKKNRKAKRNLQHQDGMGVCFPSPPQTPPIHLSVCDFENRCNQFFSHISQPPQGALCIGDLIGASTYSRMRLRLPYLAALLSFLIWNWYD